MRRSITAVMSVAILGSVCLCEGATWTVNASGGGDFTTIQAAINAASPNDTIDVSAGTYDEHLTISKSLNLLGPQWNANPVPAGARSNSAAEATITEAGLGYSNPDVLVEIPLGVQNVTLAGFTLYGNATNTNADTSAVRCWDNNLAISNNIINGMYGIIYKGNTGLTVSQNAITANNTGVAVQPNAAANVAFTGNSFFRGTSPTPSASAMYATGVTGLTVSGNVASGFSAGNALGGSGLTNVLVSGNTFTNGKNGVNIWGNTTHVTIEDNTLTGMNSYGVTIKGQHIDIDNNQITGNTTGVYVANQALALSDVTVGSNNIFGNTVYGFQADPGAGTIETVNAAGNWWGDPSGPYDNKSLPGTPDYNNPAGLGNQVTSYVDYAGWLTSPVPEPGTLVLLLMAGLGLLCYAWRRRQAASHTS